MKNWLNKYFGFTKREYNGLLFLMAILLLLAVLPQVYRVLFAKQEPLDKTELVAIQRLQLASSGEPESRFSSNYRYAKEERNVKSALFRFDPNLIDASQWQRLGLSPKQAQSIVNYRNKGGRFYKVEDLQKMYVISPEMYERLKPYVTIEGSATNGFENRRPFEKSTLPPKKDLVVIELNGADTLQLDEVRGIGATFAKRIIKYREKLGGFYKKEQLLEVFGLDSVKFEEIKAQVRVDASQLKKININTAVFEELKNHPYLKYKQINAIIQYRKQHGNYKDVEDLKKVAILTPQNIQNLAPYLTF